jgi:hypothetical protein
MTKESMINNKIAVEYTPKLRVDSFAQMQSVFIDTPSRYRGKGFWAWNGSLDIAKLKEQIRIMKKMGMGGFYMHARTGLKTEYLGKEWFDCIRACCQEAQTLDMEAWVYDEDRWPSGFAGGQVTIEPKYRQHRLAIKISSAENFVWQDNTIAAFAAKIDGNKAFDVTAIKYNYVCNGNEHRQIVSFNSIKAMEHSVYNGQTYVDALSHEAIDRFIKITHEAYKREVGQYFGKTIPGIFSDEPNHGPVCEESLFEAGLKADKTYITQIPWTAKFSTLFKDRYGYDILPHLMEVVFDVNAIPVQKARHDYHDCLAFLFTEAFGKQIGKWCRHNNLAFTGHVLHESPLSKQASFVSSAMRFYEHMDNPGIDILTSARKEYQTVKQCTSVQRQLGKKNVLSEMYGCTGWDFTFEDYKYVGNWQAALGVNERCLHLLWYTMAGQAKRDYPPSIFYQSPWWKEYKTVEDYFARLNLILTRSLPVRNVCVLHPNESMWQEIKVGWQEQGDYKKIDNQTELLAKWLLHNQIDFDYIDEEMLARLGSVEVRAEKPELKMGCAEYNLVIVPPLLTIRSSTIELLENFVAKGGHVIFAGEAPAYVDAQPSHRAGDLSKLCNSIEFDCDKLIKALAKDKDVQVRDENQNPILDVLSSCRKDSDGHYFLFIVNDSRQKDIKHVTVSIKSDLFHSYCQEWDLTNGKIIDTPCNYKDGLISIDTSLFRSGSRLFVISSGPINCKQSSSIEKNNKKQLSSAASIVNLNQKWTFELSEPNVLVLDFPCYRVDDGQWQDRAQILEIDRRVRHLINLPERKGKMVQPWFKKTVTDNQQVPLELRYKFDIASLPQGDIQLAIENPEQYRIYVNRNKIQIPQQLGFWVDPCLSTLPVPHEFFKEGKNEILVQTIFSAGTNLESMFLLGKFAVSLDGVNSSIGSLSDYLISGDWVSQGLPFYSGSVSYISKVTLPKTGFNRVVVELPECKGSYAKIFVNDMAAELLPWAPYIADITKYVSSDSFELKIEICSHRRNSFGPLHLAQNPKLDGWIGPDEFITKGVYWQDSYKLVPCGLLSQPIIRFFQG